MITSPTPGGGEWVAMRRRDSLGRDDRLEVVLVTFARVDTSGEVDWVEDLRYASRFLTKSAADQLIRFARHRTTYDRGSRRPRYRPCHEHEARAIARVVHARNEAVIGRA